MSPLLTTITGISILLLLVHAIHHAYNSNRWREFVFHTVALSTVVIILFSVFRFPFPNDLPQLKGAESKEVYFVILLYVCMLLGLVSQYVYDRYSRSKRKRKKFDIGELIAPIAASPIVFLPLLAALENASVELSGFTASSIMLFLVAFENGFFWKVLVNQRMEQR